MRKLSRAILKLGAYYLLLTFPVAAHTENISHQSQSTAFSSSHFTITDEGTTQKPDIIFIPGLSEGRDIWANKALRLSSDYHLHMLQINGFAGQKLPHNTSRFFLLPSVVKQLHNYITTRHMHPVLIGHSLGGLIALMLSQQYPQDVSKIIVVDTLPFYGNLYGPQATVENTKKIALATRDNIVHQNPEQAKQAQKQIAQMLALSPAGQQYVLINTQTSDPAIVAQALYEDAQTDLRPQILSNKVKTLVLYAYDPTLYGKTDQKIPAGDYMETIFKAGYKNMPDVTLVRIDNSRHLIMFDQPEAMHKAIEDFLR